MVRSIWRSSATGCPTTTSGRSSPSPPAGPRRWGDIWRNAINTAATSIMPITPARTPVVPSAMAPTPKGGLRSGRRNYLPVPYFHLVFTLPAELREVVRSNQKALYAVLFEAAIAALTKLGLDRKYLGGQLGMVAVLHTWTRAKEYHPHLHLLVPGGALDKDGVWRPARRKFLVPVKALSPIFRAIFMKRATEGAAQRKPSPKRSGIRTGSSSPGRPSRRRKRC